MHNSLAYYVITHMEILMNILILFQLFVKQIFFREIINLLYNLPGRFFMELIWTLDGYRETLVFML